MSVVAVVGADRHQIVTDIGLKGAAVGMAEGCELSAGTWQGQRGL